MERNPVQPRAPRRNCALAAADTDNQRAEDRSNAIRRRIATAEEKMARLRRALDAGWDPEEQKDQYNAAAAEKRSLEADLAALQPDTTLSRSDIEMMIDQVGDMVDALDQADQEELAEIYRALELSMTYHHPERVLDVRTELPHGDKYGV